MLPDQGSGVDLKVLEDYLRTVFDPATEILKLAPLGEFAGDDVKRYGYGTAIEVVYRVGGRDQRAVFQTVRPGPHGHETMPGPGAAATDQSRELLSLATPGRLSRRWCCGPGWSAALAGELRGILHIDRARPGRRSRERLLSNAR